MQKFNKNMFDFAQRARDEAVIKSRSTKSSVAASLIKLPGLNFLCRHKNFCFLFLSILSILAVGHVWYIGNILDSFIFATLFGYFRYILYAMIFLTFLVLILNLEHRSFFKYLMFFLFFAFFIGNAWTFVIAIDQDKKHTSYLESFSGSWHFVTAKYREAWRSSSHVFKDYQLVPGGVFGAFLYSCFYIFQNPTAAQVMFWLSTIIVFLLSLGYFVFHDFFFVVRCGEACKLWIVELFNLFRLRVLGKSRYLIANYFVKTRKESENFKSQPNKSANNFMHNLKYEMHPATYLKDRPIIPRSQTAVYNPEDRINNSFADKTREIIRGTIMRNYNARKSILDFNEFQNDRVNNELISGNMNTFFDDGRENQTNRKKIWNKKKRSKDSSTGRTSELSFSDEQCKKILNQNLNFFKYNQQRYLSEWKSFDFDNIHFHARKQNRLEIKNYARSNEQKLLKIFLKNNVLTKILKINVSDKFIQYVLKLPKTVMASRIHILSERIKVALAQQNVSIEVPLANRNEFGVSLPNPYSTILTFKEVFEKLCKPNEISKLEGRLLIGRKNNSIDVIANFSKMPNLLIVGGARSGKSVSLRNLVLSLALINPPHKLNLLLVDSQKSEFKSFYDLPHLLTPIVCSFEKIFLVLDQIIKEIKKRYKVLRKFKCSNIDHYNDIQTNNQLKIPRIVVVVAEFAELMIYHHSLIEEKVVKISQLSRAVGIHLVFATTNASTKIISNLIKINFPCRIAFACLSAIDSRIIIDTPGAEALLGNGDMLYTSQQYSRPIRLQSPFIDQENSEIICNFLREQALPVYVENLSIDYEETAEFTRKS